tara:strand:+ start:836 stop:1717 length:882 start_codon:yes stop_codon:yes gene_type:complete
MKKAVNVFLYFFTVFAWGSAWVAIENQLNYVSIEVALFSRFFVASIIMLTICGALRLKIHFSLKEHFYIFSFAVLNFSVNYFIVYKGLSYLDSSIASIIFTSMVIMNIFNYSFFFNEKMSMRSYVGSAVGFVGVVIVFGSKTISTQYSISSFIGLGLVLLSAYVASLGNMVAIRNSRNKLPLIQVNALAMLYGTFVLSLGLVFTNAEIVFPTDNNFILSTLYLSVVCTVMGFYSYYKLLESVSPAKCSYIIALFPIVAVLLNVFLEQIAWSIFLTVGLLFSISGNIIVLSSRD